MSTQDRFEPDEYAVWSAQVTAAQQRLSKALGSAQGAFDALGAVVHELIALGDEDLNGLDVMDAMRELDQVSQSLRHVERIVQLYQQTTGGAR